MNNNENKKILSFNINDKYTKEIEFVDHYNILNQDYSITKPDDAEFGKFYSWFIIDENFIIKKTDLSVFKSKGSGIPKDIRWFFEVENLSINERLDISLIYNKENYDAYISRESTLGRTRIFWHTDLDKQFNTYYKPGDQFPDLLFERIGKNKYNITFERRSNDIIEPLDEKHSYDEREKHAKTMDINSLKYAAKKHSKKKPIQKSVTVTHIYRDPYIAEYAKQKAKGICQLCNKEAPFIDNHGKPFLESHHIIWLKDGGEDTIENTVALCPNCHRKMHYAPDEESIKILIDKAKE